MSIKKIVGIGIILSSVCLAHGETIQFDFSRYAGNLYSGNDAPAALSGTTWNEVVTADVTSGLVYSDGTSATGVSLDVGTGDPINWANDLGGWSGTSAAAPAMYQTDLMKDWNYVGNANNLGVRVTGLANGEYEVYALVREGNNADGLARTYDVGIGLNASTLAGLTQSSIAADLVPDGTPEWTAGINYVMTTVTVGSLTDAITVIVDNTNNKYATLSGIQIVAVSGPTPMPDPAELNISTDGGLPSVGSTNLSAAAGVTNFLQVTAELNGTWNNLYFATGVTETNWMVPSTHPQSFFRIETSY